jgi:hypothetical protein
MNNEDRGVVTLDPHPNGSDGQGDAIVTAYPSPVTPTVTEEVAPTATLQASAEPSVVPAQAGVRRRRGWVLPAALAAAGLIASGSLGGLLVSTIGQRDSARHQLSLTQAGLANAKGQLSAAQADIAARKLTAAYSRIWIGDGGQVLTDYETVVVCNAYSDCRTAAQQTLTDLQAFQSDRAAATVPPAFQSADGTLRDSLSAAIAGIQEFIAGMDNDDVNKITDGGKKVDQAMLSIGKAESALAKGFD